MIFPFLNAKFFWLYFLPILSCRSRKRVYLTTRWLILNIYTQQLKYFFAILLKILRVIHVTPDTNKVFVWSSVSRVRGRHRHWRQVSPNGRRGGLQQQNKQWTGNMTNAVPWLPANITYNGGSVHHAVNIATNQGDMCGVWLVFRWAACNEAVIKRLAQQTCKRYLTMLGSC